MHSGHTATLTDSATYRATPGLRLVSIVGFILCQSSLIAQQPPIQIVSPLAGTVVAPGQLLSVVATLTPGSMFSGVFVIAQNIGISPKLSTAPFTFSFVAPGGGFVGSLALTAVGVTAAGSPVFSQSVLVSVENSSALSSLSVSPSLVSFSFAGQQMPLFVTGTFADGSTADITHSSQVTYGSNDITVAQVGSDGKVTAIGSGATSSTEIFVRYGVLSKNITVSVPKTIPGDLNGDGKVDQDDLNTILSALNSQATKPFDARDLNKDGLINALDSRVLVTLCTRPGCATH